MALSTNDFWRLLVESRLWSAADCQKLQKRFADVKGSPQQTIATELAEWLVAQRALTRYQAKVLLSGRAGPFIYGDYQLRDRVVAGRLGGCFKAVHIATQHRVLLWFLRGPVAQDPQMYAAAVSQIAVAVQAAHPCLWQTYQLVDLGKFKFVVLEYLAGSTADDALGARSRLNAAEACRLMRHAALGLSALHAVGAIHGEIRPGNVWIDPNGNGMLLQLPLSREPHLLPSSPLDPTLGDDHRRTLADYSAPELGFAGYSPDALSDMYAIGCTLYHLLSGRPPFSGGDVATKMKRHATEAIEPLEPLGVPAKLAQVVAYAMAKDRQLRYQSAAQLAEALAYFIEPAHGHVYPQRAPTNTAYEVWRQTQRLVPQIAGPPRSAETTGMPTFAHAPAAPIGIEASSPLPPPTEAIATGGQVGSNIEDPLGFVDRGATTSPAAALLRRRARTRKNALGTIAFLLALGLAGALGYAVYYFSRSPEIAIPFDETGTESTREQSADGPAKASDSEDGDGENADPLSSPGQTNIVADDGKALWVSPTDGPSISWAYVPARAEIALALRPAELVRHPEGEKLLAALGPNGQQARLAVEEATGMPLSEIEHLVIAWTNSNGHWIATYVVRPAAAIRLETLVARWQNSEEMASGAEKYFIARDRAYFAPSAEQGKTFVVSAPDQTQEILARGKDSAPFSREIVKLLQTSDSQRLVTIVFSKEALLANAQPQFAAAGLSSLRDAISWLLQEDIRAAAFSLHLAEHCYLEARVVGVIEMSPGQLVVKLRDRLNQLASDVEAYLGQIEFHPYGKRVLLRLARMAEFVRNQLRIEAEGDQVVINAYLPAVAAHNLVLGTELAVVDSNGTAIVQPAVDTPPFEQRPATVAEKLKRPISFVQQLDTLENAAKAVSAEVGVPIEVLGADLQPEGITRNNQFGIEAKEQPASDVLRAILLKANPEGKLVYVIKPKSPGGEEMVFITTVAAASRRGDKVPAEFLIAPR